MDIFHQLRGLYNLLVYLSVIFLAMLHRDRYCQCTAAPKSATSDDHHNDCSGIHIIQPPYAWTGQHSLPYPSWPLG